MNYSTYYCRWEPCRSEMHATCIRSYQNELRLPLVPTRMSTDEKIRKLLGSLYITSPEELEKGIRENSTIFK